MGSSKLGSHKLMMHDVAHAVKNLDRTAPVETSADQYPTVDLDCPQEISASQSPSSKLCSSREKSWSSDS